MSTLQRPWEMHRSVDHPVHSLRTTYNQLPCPSREPDGRTIGMSARNLYSCETQIAQSNRRDFYAKSPLSIAETLVRKSEQTKRSRVRLHPFQNQTENHVERSPPESCLYICTPAQSHNGSRDYSMRNEPYPQTDLDHISQLQSQHQSQQQNFDESMASQTTGDTSVRGSFQSDKQDYSSSCDDNTRYYGSNSDKSRLSEDHDQSLDSHERFNTSNLFSDVLTTSKHFIFPEVPTPDSASNKSMGNFRMDDRCVKDKDERKTPNECACVENLKEYAQTLQRMATCSNTRNYKLENKFLLDVMFSEGAQLLYHIDCINLLTGVSKPRLKRLQDRKWLLAQHVPVMHGLLGRRSNNSKSPTTLKSFINFVKNNRIEINYKQGDEPMMNGDVVIRYRIRSSLLRLKGGGQNMLRTEFNLYQQSEQGNGETISSGTAQAWFKKYFRDTIKGTSALQYLMREMANDT
eukprot:CFRG1399T1